MYLCQFQLLSLIHPTPHLDQRTCFLLSCFYNAPLSLTEVAFVCVGVGLLLDHGQLAGGYALWRKVTSLLYQMLAANMLSLLLGMGPCMFLPHQAECRHTGSHTGTCSDDESWTQWPCCEEKIKFQRHSPYCPALTVFLPRLPWCSLTLGETVPYGCPV